MGMEQGAGSVYLAGFVFGTGGRGPGPKKKGSAMLAWVNGALSSILIDPLG